MARFNFSSRAGRTWVLAAIAAASLGLAACGKGDKPAAGQAAGAKAAPVVGVMTVQLGSVPLVTELPGRLEASRIAQVRARTAGVVLKRMFQEGSMVKQGQSLFQIDNSVLMATLQSAKAALAKAQAALAQANDTVSRYKPLVEANAISKQEFVTAQTAQRAATADVEVARAALRNAEINVGYSYAIAPISGRIGKAQVTEGALVGQGEATLLATIQQMNPMVVNFTQSASDMMKLRNTIQGEGAQASTNHTVKVVLEDGSIYPIDGRLLFADATVDAATGQVSFKAEIPNPQGQLLPGLFVRVQLEQAKLDNAVLVPQQAVTRGGAQGDTVMIANADGSFAPRVVQIARAHGDNWVVVGGLKEGDQVIVEGMSMVQMTQAKQVQTRPWTPKGNAATAVVNAQAASSAAPAASAASGVAPAASATASAASAQ